MELLKKHFDSLDFSGSFQIGLLDNRHLLIQFQLQEDYLHLYSTPVWHINGIPMRILKWSSSFHVDRELPVAPVWIGLPRLPIHYFEHRTIFAIAGLIGTPLRIDSATASLKRPSIARVQVEVNLLEEHPNQVWISEEGENGFWQKVDYEKIPDYCKHCWHIGHAESSCRVRHPELKVSSKRIVSDSSQQLEIDASLKPPINDTQIHFNQVNQIPPEVVVINSNAQLISVPIVSPELEMDHLHVHKTVALQLPMVNLSTAAVHSGTQAIDGPVCSYDLDMVVHNSGIPAVEIARIFDPMVVCEIECQPTQVVFSVVNQSAEVTGTQPIDGPLDASNLDMVVHFPKNRVLEIEQGSDPPLISEFSMIPMHMVPDQGPPSDAIPKLGTQPDECAASSVMVYDENIANDDALQVLATTTVTDVTNAVKFHPLQVHEVPLDKGKMVASSLNPSAAIFSPQMAFSNNPETSSSQRLIVDLAEYVQDSFQLPGFDFGNTQHEEEESGTEEDEEDERDFMDQQLIRDDIYLEQHKSRNRTRDNLDVQFRRGRGRPLGSRGRTFLDMNRTIRTRSRTIE